MRLILRVFAPAADPAEASDVARRLAGVLQAWAPAPSGPPGQYWKIPEWYEHTLELRPATRATFDAIVALAQDGWTPLDLETEMNAVWNPRAGATFLLPAVQWAELLLVHDTRAHVLYLRSNGVALSREPVQDWRDLQELHPDYMASLGPWTLAEILDHFALQFGADDSRWPVGRADIEQFMTAGRDPVLRATVRP